MTRHDRPGAVLTRAATPHSPALLLAPTAPPGHGRRGDHLSALDRRVLGAIGRLHGMTPAFVSIEDLAGELRERAAWEPRRAFLMHTLAGLVRCGNLSTDGRGWRVERLS